MTPFTISALGKLFRTGELTPIELVEHCLARIDQLEDRLQAWVLVDYDGARTAARQATDELARGVDHGPLHGIPIGIKDIVDVAGWPTLAGSTVRDNRPAEHDAPLVAQLRAAGAIFLGKTVTTEFACFDPPPTRNPWNPGHTPGGSSSGSAAAVAVGMCVAAIGSQTGGSITRPATFCGVAGCKPTFGCVSLEGLVPVSPRLDHPGPIGRSAGDLGLLLQTIALPGAQLDAGLDPVRSKSPPRIGWLQGFFISEAAPAVRAATQTAVERLRRAGATIESVGLPASFVRVHEMHLRIMASDAAAYHRPTFQAQPDRYGRHIAQLIRTGEKVTPAAYFEAVEHQQTFRREMQAIAAAFDGLLAPATVTPAPTPETTGDARFNSPWSFAGFPVVSIPCSLADDGLPCGLQFIGPPHTDLAMVELAAWCEERIGFQAEPMESSQ
jgi:Asp-tRNA(Asn)/Glu-tRNA(Gln) amidotransferase A subunit family amidase